MQSNTTIATKNKSSTHGRFHQCTCYGHENTLPDYKYDISIPHTLQGYYALHGGCPCPPSHPQNKNAHSSSSAAVTVNNNDTRCNDTCNAHESSHLQCPLHSQCKHPENKDASNITMNKTKCNAYREAAGNHTVYKADDTQPQNEGDKCKCCSDDNNTNSINKNQRAIQMTRSFPNARNYGGTAARSGVMMFTNNQTTQRKQREAKMQKVQDRIDFLRSLLHDEMCDRIQAEQLRTEIEMELKLLGSYHAKELREENTKDTTQNNNMSIANDANTLHANGNTMTSMSSVNKYIIPTVAQSHANIMEELEYVSNEPLGSKENIIRLYYLLQEEEQNAKLRRGRVHK